MHVPLEHTHIHTHYMANNHIFIQIHSKLQCSTKFEQMVPVAAGKLKKKILVLNTINA